MPGGAERVLRRRINSVSNTKKITRAMELIAATRVARAQQRSRAARPYSEQLTGVIEDLAASGADANHPLLRHHIYNNCNLFVDKLDFLAGQI